MASPFDMRPSCRASAQGRASRRARTDGMTIGYPPAARPMRAPRETGRDTASERQRSARVHASQTASIAGCDLIIDATGDAATSLFLGAVAAANNRAFISVEVYEGGIGALIASCLPGRDPPFVQARAAYFAWCDEKNMRPPRPAARPYDALAEDGSLMVADDAAASITASHAARVALDVFDGRPAGPEAAWMLIGFRKSWVFEGHGHTWLLSVGTPAMPDQESEDAEAEAFVLALAKEHFGADATGE